MKSKRENNIGDIVLEIVAISFLASAGFFVRNSRLSPINTGLWRMILALPFLFVLSFKDLRKISYKDIALSILSGLFLAGDLIFFNMSLVMTSMANTNLITNLTPFITVPVSYFLFKEKVSKTFLAGLLISMFGAVLLVTGKASPTASNYIGDIYAGVACIFYALFYLVTYKVRDRVKSSTIMFYGAFGTIFALLIASAGIEGLQAPKTLNDFWILLGFALSLQVIGQNLLAHCQGKISINLSSAIKLLQPVIAALFSFFVFKEILTIKEIVAMAIVIIGVYICKKEFN